MKKGSTTFLQCVIILLGVVALAVMIRFPQTEGRAAHLDLLSIYANPFIIYLYISSLTFFVALFQAFKLLRYVDQNKMFSQAAVKAVKNIKYCAITFIGFILAAEAYLFLFERSKSDDPAGGVAMGVLLIFVSAVIATAAAVFQKLLQNAVDLQSENDLTV